MLCEGATEKIKGGRHNNAGKWEEQVSGVEWVEE
jgi:hypothetical protein